ncbi:MAG: phage major capsid protein [Vicinamibacterales bacterium]
MRTLSDLTRSFEADGRARNFIRYAQAKALGLRHDELPSNFEPFQKASVDAATSGNTSALARLSRDYLAVVESRTILGRLRGTMPAPPGTNLTGTINDPDGSFVTAGGLIPAARINFTAAHTEPSLIALILALTRDLVRSTDDRSTSYVERVLTRAIRRAEDRLLLDDEAAVSGHRPAGLLHGRSSVGSGSPDTLGDSIYNLFTAVSDGAAEFPTFVCSPRAAMHLACLTTASGQLRFPNAGPLGGDIAGVPLITSPAAGNRLVLIDGAQIVVSDEGMTVDKSDVAAIELDDAPSGSGQLVAAMQTNSTFLKVLRYIDWRTVNDDAVAFLELEIDGSPV